MTVTTWYSNATPEETDRLLAAWPDAPIQNAELCSFLLDVAREQVIEYAPADALVLPGVQPVTVELPEVQAYVSYLSLPSYDRVAVPVDGSVRGTVTLTRTGNVVQAVFDLSWTLTEKTDLPAHVGEDYRLAPLGESSAWSLEVLAGFTPMQQCVSENPDELGISIHSEGIITDIPWGQFPSTPQAVRVELAWVTSDPLPAQVQTSGNPYIDIFEQNLGTSAGVTGVPVRLVYAQLQQATNLWNAGRAQGDGDIGSEGYSFQPRPLDKTIRAIIRPTSGAANVF